MQASTANSQHDTGSPVPAIPPELLETVARALAAALVPSPRQPLNRRDGRPGLPDRSAARAAAGSLPGDGAAAGHRRDAAAHRGMPRHPEDHPPVPAAVRRRLRGQRPGCSRPGRLRRRLAGAGHRARTVTDRPSRYRNLAKPTRFAARWREQAACRDTDLDVFFPERGESAGPARQVCARCPVRQPCLDYAISNRIAYGIWGGLTGRERRAQQSRWVRAARQDRDEAILAADAAGYTAEAIGRSFGLSRMTGDPDRAYREPGRPRGTCRFTAQTLPSRKDGR